jgi:hypothetical protein
VGAIYALLLQGTVSDSAGEWPDYFSISELVEDSDAIVVARFVDEEREVVELRSPTVSTSGATRTDLIRSYEVVETIKGNGIGSEVRVWSSEGIEDVEGIRSQGFDVAGVEPDTLYVLFLKRFAREREPIWGRTGEPELAEIIDGDLRFISSDRYVHEAEERGLDMATSASRAPFAVTLDELRMLVR